MIPSNLSKASKDIKGYLQIEYLDIMDSYTIIQGLDSWMNFWIPTIRQECHYLIAWGPCNSWQMISKKNKQGLVLSMLGFQKKNLTQEDCWMNGASITSPWKITKNV